jgi:hypothetical protein
MREGLFHDELYWPLTPAREYGYETTGRPHEVAVDARSRA